MLIVMDSQATAEDVRRVVAAVEGLGLAAHAIPGAQRTAIAAIAVAVLALAAAIGLGLRRGRKVV